MEVKRIWVPRAVGRGEVGVGGWHEGREVYFKSNRRWSGSRSVVGLHGYTCGRYISRCLATTSGLFFSRRWSFQEDRIGGWLAEESFSFFFFFFLSVSWGVDPIRVKPGRERWSTIMPPRDPECKSRESRGFTPCWPWLQTHSLGEGSSKAPHISCVRVCVCARGRERESDMKATRQCCQAKQMNYLSKTHIADRLWGCNTQAAGALSIHLQLAVLGTACRRNLENQYIHNA